MMTTHIAQTANPNPERTTNPQEIADRAADAEAAAAEAEAQAALPFQAATGVAAAMFGEVAK